MCRIDLQYRVSIECVSNNIVFESVSLLVRKQSRMTNQSAGEIRCIESWSIMLIEAYKLILSN